MENIEDASEKIAVESNVCKFHYTSIKKIYSLTNGSAVAPKTDYTKIEDILDDYYWVRYSFGVSRNHNGILKAYDNNGILVTDRNSSCIKEILQDECVLYDANLNKIEAEENNIYYYLNPSTSLSNPTYYYVGYPKYKYNDGDKITNTVELWGRYEDEEEFQKLSEKSQTISLVDFDFEYTGKLYNIEKSKYIKEINENNIKSTFGSDAYWNMDVTAFYTGSMMDVEICDDLLYITRENGSVSKLNEDEYRFKSIEIPVLYTYSKFTGSVGDVLSGYNYEVQVRYEGSNEYVRYRSGVTSASSKRIYFRSNDVVGVKFIIKDLDKTLYPKKGTTLEGIKLCVNINTNDCKTGDLYNFNYLQVYEKDSEGNRELANEVELDNYITPSTLKIAEYDINTYGTYMQRDYDIIEIKNGSFKLGSSKSMENLINNVKKEKYETQYKINNILEIDSRSVDKECIIKQYDVLPDGVKLASTKEEIKDEIYSDIAWKLPYLNLKLKDGTKFKTLEELINYIKENTTVEIDYNYKDSGRTKISLIYNLNNIDWSYYLKRKSLKMYLGTKLNVEIPYDSILEYGTSYTNYVYSMWNNQEYEYNNDYLLTLDESDIDEDGDTTETLVFDCAILNINHVIASQQTVIKQVRTDLTKGEFTSRSVDVTAGSEYTYKLKVTTGANSLKDLIIYDNIETILDESGNDISSGWKGKFLGVDTSYAISKGYAPVVYYSEEINPGKLTEDETKWKVLTDDVDKTIVKSICVDLRYRADGTEMELSGNNVVYVLVNMMAPSDDTIIESSKNMFSTNWRAKDPIGTVIDNVEGIYSNQINVNIYKKENEKKDIVGKKTWNDGWKYESYRPKSITVKLLQDGIEYMRKEVSESDGWEYEFLDVPIYKNVDLEEYEYSIEEEEISTYEAIYDGYNITNKLKTVDIEIEKIWDDNDNEKGLRPSIISVKLFDGENLLKEEWLDKWHDWKCTFYDLPEYREDGSKIEYTIDEEVKKAVEFWYGSEYVYEVNFETDEEFELYKRSYVKEIVGNTIINRYIDPDERIKITGTKIWDDNKNKAGKRPESIVLQIKNGGKVVSEGVVNEANNWSFEFEVLKNDEEGNEISYHIDERETTKFYEKELTNETTVKNKFKVPDEKIKVPVIKLWEDGEDKYSKRPNSITLQVFNGDKLIAEEKVNKKDNWRAEFELPKYDELGNEIEYRVDEKETDENYEKRVSGYTVINKCIDDPTTDTSDINVFVYVLIFFMAVIGIIVGLLSVKSDKLNLI